jgi:hypothetical protein
VHHGVVFHAFFVAPEAHFRRNQAGMNDIGVGKNTIKIRYSAFKPTPSSPPCQEGKNILIFCYLAVLPSCRLAILLSFFNSLPIKQKSRPSLTERRDWCDD